ncbi:hypothetical protein [Klebsiella pneumoniae ISC21]|nr:hypothetical protein [Klebsiella pneumoniae ISC21]
MTLSCIEMKSKTILILNGRNGKTRYDITLDITCLQFRPNEHF